jgi:hypothetical protein
MRFSRVANRELYRALASAAAFTAVVGDRIHRGPGYPAGTALPACLFYLEQSTYDSGQLPGAEHIDGSQMRYVVRLDDIGSSDARIAVAADAQLEAMAGLIVDTDDGYQVTFTAMGEVPLSGGYVDGDTFYQRLGDIYRVDVTKG